MQEANFDAIIIVWSGDSVSASGFLVSEPNEETITIMKVSPKRFAL